MAKKNQNVKPNSIILGKIQAESPEVFQVSKYYCIVFDLCSSSVILENLQQNGNIMRWVQFWRRVTHKLKLYGKTSELNIYKFIGDGFLILLKEDKKEFLMDLCMEIYNIVNKEVEALLERYCEISPDRIGVTIGVEFGDLVQYKISDAIEYSGKAINVATRLQASLKNVEHANKLLVSKMVKHKIDTTQIDENLKRTNRVLHNLYGDHRFDCFEIDLKQLRNTN